MIFKSDLLEAIDANTEQIAWQGQLIAHLRDKVAQLEKELSDKKTTTTKKVGRPKKTCTCEKSDSAKVKKSDNAKKQPRTKDGKFTKKK